MHLGNDSETQISFMFRSFFYPFFSVCNSYVEMDTRSSHICNVLNDIFYWSDLYMWQYAQYSFHLISYCNFIAFVIKRRHRRLNATIVEAKRLLFKEYEVQDSYFHLIVLIFGFQRVSIWIYVCCCFFFFCSSTIYSPMLGTYLLSKHWLSPMCLVYNTKYPRFLSFFQSNRYFLSLSLEQLFLLIVFLLLNLSYNCHYLLL